MEGSPKSILHFKIKSSKIPNNGALNHHSIDSTQNSSCRTALCITVLAYMQGIYKKPPCKWCYSAYHRSGAEYVIPQSRVCSVGKISLRSLCHGKLGLRVFFNARKTRAQHVLLQVFFLIFLYVFPFPLVSSCFNFILLYITFIHMYISLTHLQSK